MSITDELREYATVSWGPWPEARDRLLKMCDRIDAEHKKACHDAWDNGYEADYLGIEKWLTEHPQVMEHHGWVRLPVDADGEVIHVGDTLVSRYEGRDYVREVEALIFTDRWDFELSDEDGDTRDVASMEDFYSNTRHHHAPTVEDVLREFAQEMNENLGMYTGEAIDADEWRDADAKTIAEYAQRLQLREVDE